MRFEWDEGKNALNIRKHGIDFNDVDRLFQQPMLIVYDDREHYGEDRWVGIGYLEPFIAVVVYVEREDDIIRIISARKATKHEVRRYEQALQN